MSAHVYACHVRFSDVDVYGHVNNVKYFEYFQEARIDFLRSLAGPEHEAGPESGTERQVVARIDVDYRRPMLFRPAPYAVETVVTRVGTSSFELSSVILDGTEEGAEVYSRAVVRLVAYDLAAHRSRPLGDGERERLERALTV